MIYDLREVGPSRKILHARGVGSERRKSERRVASNLGALGATRQISTVYTNELIWPLLVTLLASRRMRRVYAIFFKSRFHFLKRFCAFNKKTDIAVGSRSYFLRSFCVLDRHYEPLFTFKNLCRLHLTSMLFCSDFCVFLFPIAGIFALMFLS